jgi:hypothetical protein
MKGTKIPSQTTRSAKSSDQQWETVREEDRQNQEPLNLSHQILELTKAIHAGTATREAHE